MADAGDVFFRNARGTIDFARLLAWLPAGLAPVAVESAKIRYDVDSLSVSPVFRLARGGALTLDADLANVDVRVGGGALAVTGGKILVSCATGRGRGPRGERVRPAGRGPTRVGRQGARHR